MAEAIGTAASVLQIAVTAGSLARSISRFIEQTKTVAQSIRNLHDEVHSLESALRSIHETFQKRPLILSFEKNHHSRIYDVLEACQGSLQDLDQALPQLRDEVTPIEKLRLSIQKSLKGDRALRIKEHIRSHTTALQISISTLSLGELWLSRESQQRILTEVRSINERIRSANLSSTRLDNRPAISLSSESSETIRPDTPPSDDSEERFALYEKFIDSVDEVATGVFLCDPDRESCDGISIMSVWPLGDDVTRQSLQDGMYDFEDDELSDVDREILGLQLHANQEMVDQLLQVNLCRQAAKYQRRAIDKCVLLDKDNTAQHGRHSEPDPIPSLYSMKERLADILAECGTPENDLEAEEVFKQLLKEEIDHPEIDDSDRQWRLCYKLGSLYARQGNFGKSHKLLQRAFRGRSKAKPCAFDNVIKGYAESLVKTLQELQLIDDSRGVQAWLKKHFPRDDQLTSISSNTKASSSELLSPYIWCRERGFDVDHPEFVFDKYDLVKETTPLSQAIQEENVEILQQLVVNKAHVDHVDDTGSAPIHLAAATCNKRVFSIFLEKEPNMEVRDHRDMTLLHRCQRQKGGVQVAGMILSRCPDLLNYVCSIGKSALCIACEKGNEPMVEFLLSANADPNKPGPGLYVPIVCAIDGAAPSSTKINLVGRLLDKGADPKMCDVSGRNAFDAASSAGLFGSHIRDLLSQASIRRLSSTGSTATTRSSVSKNRSPRFGSINWGQH
ncbi:ankyrin [Xylariaceae sp. FL0255]|nr:ankyrin [Xylariaceae sp. FL0255]